LNALIVADGDIPTRAAVERLLGPDGAQLVVAADGGAAKAIALGFRPDVVVGDNDSMSPDTEAQLRADGVEVHVYPAAKDESDTELAVREALDRGARSIVIVGAFGGARLEHTIANLMLLAMPELAGVYARLADGASEVYLLRDGQAGFLHGLAGDFVSLFPLTPTAEVTTIDLEYELHGETLTQGSARGLSNVMTSKEASVLLNSGQLLVVHTRNER
jgi:thiamine pyrophosphokinase